MSFLQTMLQALAIGITGCLAILEPAKADESTSAPIVIGLNADMSASSAVGGEAIRRGAIIAIDEINRAGGVLGRRLALTVRDHRGNPDRGVDNIGGVHTPVAMAELEAIHEHGIVYLELGPPARWLWTTPTGPICLPGLDS